MAIPTQIGFYERQPSGWWIDLRDGTGPYKTADGVTFTIAGSGGGPPPDPGDPGEIIWPFPLWTVAA